MCVCARARVCVSERPKSVRRQRESVGGETARERRWGDSERASGTRRQRELARDRSPLRSRYGESVVFDFIIKNEEFIIHKYMHELQKYMSYMINT